MEQEMMQEMQPEAMGRGTDTVMAHMSLGEVVIPRSFLDDPQVMEMLQLLFQENGANMAEFTVGDPANKINPETGYPEFFFKKLRKIFSVAAPIAAAFIPGLQPLAAAGLGAAGGIAGGGGLKSALLGAGLGYAGAGGLQGTAVGRGIDSLKSGIADSALGRAVGGAFDSLSNTAVGRGIGDIVGTSSKAIQGPLQPGAGSLGSAPGRGIAGALSSASGTVAGGTGGSSSFSPLGAAANIFGGLQQDAALKKQQKQLLGANQEQLANLESFDPSTITSEPGYEFARAQGEEGLNRSLAAQGGLNSGRALKAASEYNTNFAATGFQNAYNRFLQKVQSKNALIGDRGNVQANATGAGAQNIAQSLSNIVGSPVGQFGQNNMTLEQLRRLGLA